MGSAIESMAVGGVAKNKQQLINILYAFITGRQPGRQAAGRLSNIL